MGGESSTGLGEYSISSTRRSSPTDLLDAHALMMAELVDRPGKWRTGDVAIANGNSLTHDPPPPFGVPGLMKKLLSWVGETTELPAPIHAAACLYAFEFLQPFPDGNRRMGWLWHSLILSHHHPLFAQVPIEAAFRERQSDYNDVLALCDKSGTSTPFLEFAFAGTLAALTATQSLPQARQSPQDRIQNSRSHFSAQSFRRKDYLSLFPGLSPATASRDLQHAVETARLTKTGDKATARYQFG